MLRHEVRLQRRRGERSGAARRRRSSQEVRARSAPARARARRARAASRSSPLPPRRRPRAGAASRPRSRARRGRRPTAASRERRSRRSAAAASAKRLAQARVAGVDAQRAPALRVDELEDARAASAPARADRGSRPRAPRGGPRASSSGLRQSRGPRKSETTTTSARCRAADAEPCERDVERCPGRRRPARARRGARAAARRGRHDPAAEARRAPGARRRQTTPTRLPRTLAAWPRASATPRATSALRRSAVPNAIDGEASIASHVTSTRSARCDAHVGLARARGDVPVDQPHVVARDVRAHLGELGAATEHRASDGRPRAARRRDARW